MGRCRDLPLTHSAWKCSVSESSQACEALDRNRRKSGTTETAYHKPRRATPGSARACILWSNPACLSRVVARNASGAAILAENNALHHCTQTKDVKCTTLRKFEKTCKSIEQWRLSQIEFVH